MNDELIEKEFEIKGDIEAQEKAILSMEKEIEDKIKEKEDIIEGLQKKIVEIQETMQQEMQQKVQESEESIQNLNTQLSDIQEKLKNFEAQDSRQTKVIKKMKKEGEQKTQEIEDKEKQLEKAIAADEQLVAKVDELKAELEQKLESINEKNNQIEELKKEQKNLQDEFENLKTEYQDLKQQKTGLIQGRENIINIMNNLLDNAKMRVLIVAPTIEDINQIELQRMDKKINIRVATFIDLKNEKHKEVLDTFEGFPNISFRNFEKQDRWGLEHDREEIILAAHSSSALPMGMLSNDPKHIEFFLALLSEAWISGKTL